VQLTVPPPLGFFRLGGVKFSPLHVPGIATNTSGGMVYSCVEFRRQRRRMAAEQRRREAPGGERV
jgi:hypothetical protein